MFRCPGAPSVIATTHGFVARIDVDAIAAAAAQRGPELEVVLRVSIGTFVAYEHILADVKANSYDDALAVGRVVECAIHREPQRDITTIRSPGSRNWRTSPGHRFRPLNRTPILGYL